MVELCWICEVLDSFGGDWKSWAKTSEEADLFARVNDSAGKELWFFDIYILGASRSTLHLLWLVNPPSPNVSLFVYTAVIRLYWRKSLLNKPWIRPYFWGGRLISHDILEVIHTENQIFLLKPTYAIGSTRLVDFSEVNVHPWKLTWHWKILILNRKYIFKWWIVDCHVSFFLEGVGKQTMDPVGIINPR